MISPPFNKSSQNSAKDISVCVCTCMWMCVCLGMITRIKSKAGKKSYFYTVIQIIGLNGVLVWAAITKCHKLGDL